MAGSNYVAYNLAQSRSDGEKAQARNNIGAAALASLAASFESRAPSYNWSAREVCTYGGALWQFDANHSGAWTGSDVHIVTIYDVLDFELTEFTNAARNGWVDRSDLIVAEPGITLSTKLFYTNEILGLYRFGIKAYGSANLNHEFDIATINYTGFVMGTGIAILLEANGLHTSKCISFAVYDDEMPGHEHKVVVWANNVSQAAGITGASIIGVLK